MRTVRRAILYAVLVLVAVIMVFPFYWMLITSVKVDREVLLYPPTFFPQSFTFKHFGTIARFEPGDVFQRSLQMDLRRAVTATGLVHSSTQHVAFEMRDKVANVGGRVADGALVEQQGLYFDEYRVGETFIHYPRRVFTEMDVRRQSREALELDPDCAMAIS